MKTSDGDDNRARLVARMVEHGATQVEMAELMEKAQIVWRIGANEDVSETCIHSEELMASGARELPSRFSMSWPAWTARTA